MKNSDTVISIVTIVLILITQFLTPVTVYADNGDNTPVPPNVPEVTVTSLPPQALEALSKKHPKKTITPVSTETEEGTVTPQPTDTPEETPTPNPTDTAEETPTTSPTETPEVTSAPLPTDTPEVTSTASPTETLGATPAPSATETPEETAAPESTATTDSSESNTVPPPETMVDPVETATATPLTSASDPAATDVIAEASTVEILTPSATDTDVATDATSTDPTLLETIDTLAGDTSLVVLDANGQPLSLATQEAADIIANSDPVWCPDGVVPTPGTNGCTASYLTMNDLLTNASVYINGQNVNGTIWITSGNVGDASSIMIDGSVYTNWANYSLTLQGGWSGFSGDTTIGSNSLFDVPIIISNWNNDVAINNITVNGATGSGLGVSTNGSNVTISNSSFTNNKYDPNSTSAYGYGDGVDIYPNGGNVTITNSHFDGNDFSGIYVDGNANVSIDGSTFNQNKVEGADVFLSGGNVSITGSSFTNNGSDGADIFPGAGTTTITNSQFNGNSYSGLYLYSNADVSIDGSSFLNNGVDGADVFPVGSNIMITGSHFNDNGWDGLYAGYANNITFDNSSANNNGAIYGGGGLDIFYTNNLNLDNSSILQNSVYGVCAYVVGNIYNSSTINPNVLLWSNSQYLCSLSGGTPGRGGHQNVPPPVPQNNVPRSGSQASFYLSCKEQYSFPYWLPNGDKVEIVCPVHGEATISRLDNTTLPGSLPAGYTYASAFQVDISELVVDDQGQYERKSIPYITDGGYIIASFVKPSQQTAASYSILYWDNGNWIPLKDYMLDSNGTPHIFDLIPGNKTREILSGVNADRKIFPPRVEVSTNFPGIFVLAQH